MTRLLHDAFINGAIVLTPSGSADMRENRSDDAHSVLAQCPECGFFRLHPETGCTLCANEKRIFRGALREVSPEGDDIARAMVERSEPTRHKYRYPKPRTLAQKQAHAARARAAKRRTAV